MNSVQNTSHSVECILDLSEERLQKVAGFCVQKARQRMKLQHETFLDYRDDMFQEAVGYLLEQADKPVNDAIYRVIWRLVEYVSHFVAEIPKGLTKEERDAYKQIIDLPRVSIEDEANDVDEWLSYRASPNLRLQHISDTHSCEEILLQREALRERQIETQATRRLIYKLLYDSYSTQRQMRALTFADVLHALLEGETKRSVLERINFSKNAYYTGIRRARGIIETYLQDSVLPEMQKCSWCEEVQVCQGCHCCETAVCHHCSTNPKLKKNPQARYCPLCSDKHTRKFIWMYLSA